jgi:hypothetical protein
MIIFYFLNLLFIGIKMENDNDQKEKQNYLRKKILEKGLDPGKFVEFLQEKKGEDGDDISNWTMEDLKIVVKEFYQINDIVNDEPEEKEKEKENKKEENNIKFIIDEDSLMDLFQKKSNENEENKINENIKPLFDFEKNFGKMNKNKSNIQTQEKVIKKEKEKEDIKDKNNEKISNISDNSKINEIKKEIINTSNINDNLTIKIEKEENDSEYGIIIPDTMKCKLMEITEFREHKDIKIEIKDPKKLETKLFSGKSVNYSVVTYPFNYIVERKYSDFNWLRETLFNLYNNILIPKMSYKGKVTKDKHDDNFIKKRMRFLERFINYIIKDETIKTSQILYDFLTIKNYEEFINKKKQYEKIKIFNFIDIKDRKSLNGELNIKINKEKETYLENVKDNTIYNSNLFKKLNSNFKTLNDEFSHVIKRLEIISDIYKQIYEVSNKYLDLNIIKESYSQMEIMFKNLGNNFNKIKSFINSEIKQYFKFIGNNYICLNEMIQNVEISKNNYIKLSKNLINKKNEIYKKDKSLPKNKILPQETKNSIKNKMIYGFYLNEIIKEYEKIRKINSYFHKRKICFFCKEQITICSEYTRILGDILMTMDSCTNR